ncbi:nucleoside triphosphate pyrophosphohydrolase [Shewanella maritima]|uniref:nucleoside triphosphate pyrophosphohydrolase n=1 Tax=Shewanella maritima TaxID=2520507 RepID=UPI003735BAA5
MNHRNAIEKLQWIMTQLRDPETGCPWDKVQDFTSIVPFTLEEAYEVADVIEQGDFDSLPDELGDLLFQVIFYCQLGKEQGDFDFEDVANRISDKLIRRHPHVFNSSDVSLTQTDLSTQVHQEGEVDNIVSTSQVKQTWEAIKQQERHQKQQMSLLDDIPKALPSLKRAIKIQKRVARVGFDWAELEPVVAKVHEEIDEVMAEAKHLATEPEVYQPKVAEEMGDLLFAVANMARHLGVDPEQALRQANYKFEKRFKGVESLAQKSDKALEQHSLEELDLYWERVKRTEIK